MSGLKNYLLLCANSSTSMKLNLTRYMIMVKKLKLFNSKKTKILIKIYMFKESF